MMLSCAWLCILTDKQTFITRFEVFMLVTVRLWPLKRTIISHKSIFLLQNSTVSLKRAVRYHYSSSHLWQKVNVLLKRAIFLQSIQMWPHTATFPNPSLGSLWPHSLHLPLYQVSSSTYIFQHWKWGQHVLLNWSVSTNTIHWYHNPDNHNLHHSLLYWQ
jgi:hypothetical protein